MINNQKYLDKKFRSKDGVKNRYAEHILSLLKYMPEWLKEEICNNKMSICNLGCRTGESVDLFKKYFKDSEVTGVDFPDYTIEETKKRYPNSSFICPDITKSKKHYDVIVSSLTLEHFQNSYEVFNNIINLADSYFVLIVPFLEEELSKEHFNSFDYNLFPLTIQDYNLAYFKEIDKTFFDHGKYWANEQILVIYANTKKVDTSKFPLEQFNNNYFDSLRTTKKDYENEINILQNQLNSYEINSKSLNHKMEELIKENKKIKLDLFSKQKKYEKLTEQNKKNISNLLYQQNISEGLNHKIEELIEENKKIKLDLFSKQKKYEKLTEQNKKNISNLLYQQNKCKQLIEKNRAYKSRKVVRFADNFWKFYYILKSYSKNHNYIAITIYLKLKSLSKIDTLIHKTNTNLINKESNLETHKKHQDVKSGLVKDTEPKANFKSDINSINPKYPKDIKVAVILDEFSYNCFKHEFNAIIVEPSNWLEIFEMEKPDLFFCESAWSGFNSKKRPWKGKIYSNVNFNYENRSTLLSILKYCKKHNIPTVFWNKEDPTHYNDKVHNFVDTALKFDHIFTTSEECVQRYKKDYGHKSVHCLMFAGQPKMFNPIEKYDRSTDIVFAGSWYNQHPQRCVEMEKIFDNILDNGYNLKIYDRMYNIKDDPDRIFPRKYRLLTNPTVPFNQIEKVYKESIYSLNINTETKSKTMFARRVFELMLCNTLVLSNYSEGMYELFGDNVIFMDEGKINLSFCEEKRSNNLYNVLRNHTYSQRFKQILDTIEYKYMPTDNNITIYYVVNDQSEIKNILKHYESITYVNKRLTLLISKNIPHHLTKNIYHDYANPEVSVYSLNYLLQNKEVSITRNKLGSDHGNPQNINELISNNTPYFIFANLQLKPDFIEKGILHYSYIEENFGVMLGDQFLFKKVKDINNVIFHNKKFMDVFNSVLKDMAIKFPVYTLQDYKSRPQKLTSDTPKIDITDIITLDSDIQGAV